MHSIERRLQQLERIVPAINPFTTGRYQMVIAIGGLHQPNGPYEVVDTITGQHVTVTGAVRQWYDEARIHGNDEIEVVIHSDNNP